MGQQDAPTDREKRRLLLLSSSRTPGTLFLEHACTFIRDFLGAAVTQVTFIPYASVSLSPDEMAAKAADAFGQLGYRLISLHRAPDPVAAVRDAQALAVAGGNTFQLLHLLQSKGLVDPIRKRVKAGLPYIGWSAGSNVACPSIRTTNDMPVVWPTGLQALDLVPFQINPHYIDSHGDSHRGETRDERLQEFMILNPGIPVVGLQEGSALRIESGRVKLLGELEARLFRDGEAGWIPPSQPLDFLLEGAVSQSASGSL